MIWRVTTMASAAALAGWLGFMASDREVPIRYSEMKPVEYQVKRGESLRVYHESYRQRSCATVINRLIFDHVGSGDSSRFVVPDLVFPYGVLPTGNDKFTISILIPESARTGKARYRVLRSYRCNLLHYLYPIYDGPFDMEFEIID